MPHIRYRDDDSSSRGALFLVIGALAGLAAGVLIAQRMGGLAGLGTRVRTRLRQAAADVEETYRGYEYDDEGYEDEVAEELTPEEELEERVLEAFRNDPVLSERAVDIGAIGQGIIELTGWVQAQDETTHALTITRGVPGVDTVINRLAVRADEDELDDIARQYDNEDHTGHWEGQQVGTGRRRQGTSAEPDRHADPKPGLEDKWLSADKAIRGAADDIDGLAERRQRPVPSQEGDRAGGAPIAPSGVPKADHVADPDNARPDSPGRNDPPKSRNG